MTKDELQDFVRRAYASYNKDLLPSEEVVVFKAWWELLMDLPATLCNAEFTIICTLDRFLLPPGQIRRRILSRNPSFSATSEGPPPEPTAMWSFLQDMIRAKNTGAAVRKTETGTHPCIQSLLTELGPQAFGMTTNGDRQFVTEAYGRHVRAWESFAFTVVERNENS